MARSKKTAAAPLTFDLPEELLAKIESCRDAHGASSASDVVRQAIERFDFAKCRPNTAPHRQISVRLANEQRAMLKRMARIKDTSVGELLRLALEAFPDRPAKAKK